MNYFIKIKIKIVKIKIKSLFYTRKYKLINIINF